MGLTQTAVARLAGLSRATVNQLEADAIQDLSLRRTARLLDVLGLTLSIADPRARAGKRAQSSDALEIAARTASVSYRRSLTAPELRQILLHEEVPAAFKPHVHALLEEAPVSLLAAVVERVHAHDGVERPQVWQRMRELARQLQCSRDLWA